MMACEGCSLPQGRPSIVWGLWKCSSPCLSVPNVAKQCRTGKFDLGKSEATLQRNRQSAQIQSTSRDKQRVFEIAVDTIEDRCNSSNLVIVPTDFSSSHWRNGAWCFRGSLSMEGEDCPGPSSHDELGQGSHRIAPKKKEKSIHKSLVVIWGASQRCNITIGLPRCPPPDDTGDGEKTCSAGQDSGVY